MGEPPARRVWPPSLGRKRQKAPPHLRQSKRKSDKLDAENLARLARVDPKLLYPLEHRSEQSQAHLALLHSREVLVRSPTQLINHVRGTVKSFGHRLPKCSACSFHDKVADGIPELLREALEPILKTIASLSARIRDYERKLETLAQEHYPESELFATGRGSWSTECLGLRADDPGGGPGSVRAEPDSRRVYLEDWCPEQGPQSGEHDPQRHLSGEGDWRCSHSSRLLVGSAHYILGPPFARDSDP